MKIRNSGVFKKWAVVVIALLVSMSMLIPIGLGMDIGEGYQQSEMDENNDFSITIHRIKQEDEIDPWPLGEADWQLRMYVNGVKKTYECVGDDIAIDKIFTWPDAIEEGMEFIDIKMELLDLDTWPNEDDIADISACIDWDYENGDYDDTTNFDEHRPAVFMRTFDLSTNTWVPEDDDNDYLNIEYSPPFYWCVTSGNFDGSTTTDQNDATIWFNVTAGNTPPYAPEKPSGEIFGWQGMIYDFSTKGFDPDGDLIQFGWDWDGDNEVDEITDYYGPWETCVTPHVWTYGQIYYVKVLAIDIKGTPSEWSEPLKVRINAPNGINGVVIEEWSLGHIYCQYFNHEKTQEILNIFASGGNIIAALSALVSAIATACGIPFPYAVIFTIATAIVRLGVEIIRMLDRGMGIYLKVYIIEVGGLPVSGFAYIWSQTATGQEGQASQDNLPPEKPELPLGETDILIGREYIYSSVTTDPNGDNITYIFDWGDGNFSCSNLNKTGVRVGMTHYWSELGSYNIRVMTLDEWGFESLWSETLTVTVTRDRKITRPVFFNLLERVIDHFPWLSRLIRTNFF